MILPSNAQCIKIWGKSTRPQAQRNSLIILQNMQILCFIFFRADFFIKHHWKIYILNTYLLQKITDDKISESMKKYLFYQDVSSTDDDSLSLEDEVT